MACRFYLTLYIVHIQLHHTVHCTEKIVTGRMHADSASAERVIQGEVGGVTWIVLCTWQPLGLTVKGSWLALDGPIIS